MTSACSILVRGVVQGVGFRPFVFRLAQANQLAGWVLNGEEGVEIHAEGAEAALQSFLRELQDRPPSAAEVASIEIQPALPAGLHEFAIRESRRRQRLTVRISPDLPVCEDCLRELFDPADRRYLYPYINCTNCGPRYTVIQSLPYDRPNTTLQAWPLDDFCAAEYGDPLNRRFHAQPVACPACGPQYELRIGDESVLGSAEAVARAAQLLRAGRILAVKGLGGYHLACDARTPEAVAALRERKFRKEKPFALMVRDPVVARSLAFFSVEAQSLLASVAHPVVLAPARADLPGVAPENHEFGVMLPYTPLHALLFAAGAPEVLVMTSANRSSEPIAYRDEEALARLAGIADGFLIGERPIARRVDDSVARIGPLGPVILRRARGYAPGAAASLPVRRPILALGADLKNTITLVVEGQCFVSQHIGDLRHSQSFAAFEETIRDLVAMYDVRWEETLVVGDCHPQYFSANHGRNMAAGEKCAVQHHRAHVASVLAERGAWDKRVLGVALDGTGHGDDGAIWGGEIFVGSVSAGFERVAHLRPAVLAGGDAAAQYPVQAAAGFLVQLNSLPDLSGAPFRFPRRFQQALQLVGKGVRTFSTTSMGRLFDTVAALVGFTREITFEGQAAMWIEHIAESAPASPPYPFPFAGGEFDFRPLLQAVLEDRRSGRAPAAIARSFQRGLAQGLQKGIMELCASNRLDTVVLSGGVLQNQLLVQDLADLLEGQPVELWTNHVVPPNDGGVSLGQAALAAFGRCDRRGL